MRRRESRLTQGTLEQVESVLDRLGEGIRRHDARLGRLESQAASLAAGIGVRRRATFTRMATQDGKEIADILSEIKRSLKAYDELLEEDLAEQMRLDRKLDEALATLHEIKLRLAPY